MTWETTPSYSNDADGSCQECGAETAEEWHAYCADCYAEQQGWRPRPHTPERGAPLVLIERVEALERRLDALERRTAA
jgi:hypothetical protein